MEKSSNYVFAVYYQVVTMAGERSVGPQKKQLVLAQDEQQACERIQELMGENESPHIGLCEKIQGGAVL